MGVFDYRGPDLNMNGIPDWDEAQASPVTQGALAPSPAQMSPVAVPPPVGILEGPLPGVTAPAGPAPTPGMMMPPEMTGLERGLSGLYNLGTMMGGHGPELNPITQAFDQRVKNYELQNQRLNAIRTGATNEDPLVRGVKQYAEAAGITDRPWDEQVAAYRKAKFADPKKTATELRYDAVTELFDGDEDKATKIMEGMVYQKERADGTIGVWDQSLNGGLGDWASEDAFTLGQVLKATELNAQAAERGTRREKYDWDTIDRVEADMMTEADKFDKAARAITLGETAIAQIESMQGTEDEPGFVQGVFQKVLGIGSEKLGELAGLSGQALINALADTTLTPVSDRDIITLEQMFASITDDPKVALGKLKVFIQNKKEDQRMNVSKMRRRVKRLGDDDIGNDLRNEYNRYLTWESEDDPEKLLNGGQ